MNSGFWVQAAEQEKTISFCIRRLENREQGMWDVCSEYLSESAAEGSVGRGDRGCGKGSGCHACCPPRGCPGQGEKLHPALGRLPDLTDTRKLK